MKRVVIGVVAVLVVAIVGGGSFFAGTAYGQSQAQNVRNEFFRNRQGTGAPAAGGQSGQNAQGAQGGQFGRPAAFGTVKSVKGNTIEVTQQDGTTVTATVDAQTTIQKTVNGTIGDIQPGERVTITSDQTGSNIAARSIQLRPVGQ